MDLLVQQEHLDAAKRAGACAGALQKYRAGTPVHEVAREHLQWIENALPDLAAAVSARSSQMLLRGKISLTMLGDGYGYGDGDGRQDVVSA